MHPERRAALLAGLGAALGMAPEVQATPAAPPGPFRQFRYRGRDAAHGAEQEGEPPAGHFRNPILSGFQPDPTLCRVGDDYYLVTSSFAYFPGLPVHHSRDLVNWRLVGHAISRPEQLAYRGVRVTRGLFAPALSFHRGTFYLVCTMVDGGGNFVITARDPAGPWSQPTWLPFEGIDPSIFFDEDGSAWIVNNGAPEGPPRYSGHRAIWLQAFDPATLTLHGPRRVLVDGGADPATRPVWIEGPHLFRRGEWLYLCAAEGGTSVQHSQVIFRSRSLAGPFEPWSGNPILTQRDLDGAAPGAVTCTGHAELVQGPGGQWWASFLGCRPLPGSAGQTWLTGRETFLLPVAWRDDGWPQILPPGRRVPLVLPAPGGARQLPSELSGNFEQRVDFTAPGPQPAWLTLHSEPGLLARRLQHGRFEAELGLVLADGERRAAGLLLLQNEAQQLFVAWQRLGAGQAECRVELRDGGHTRVLARHAASLAADASLAVRIEGEGLRLRAACATAPGAWVALGEGFSAQPLSVQAAGGGLHFTGAVLGPCVRAAA